MHLEQINGENSQYLQAIVSFPTAPASESWWRAYLRRVAAVRALGEFASAFRLSVRADGNVERLLSAVVHPGRERMLRRFFGGFSFLEGIVDDSVVLPSTAAEFGALAGGFPESRCRVLPPPLRAAGVAWLACDFRVADHLDSLVREAQSLGLRFGYQAHFRPFQPDPEAQRRVGRNLLALQAAKGIPSELLVNQERQARSFGSATCLVEEIVAADDPEAAEWLSEALAHAFKSSPAQARIDVPAFTLATDCEPDPALMMHGSLLYDDWTSDDLVCSGAADERFRSAVLALRPAIHAARGWRPPAEREADRPPDPPLPDLPLPALFEGQGHIFVSYRHDDRHRVMPIVARLAAAGFPVWYDRGIPGGEEWDAVLEKKIEDSGIVLIFLSQGAVASKYCRREIKFADAIDKPLLAVVLEAVTLAHGLKFMLQQLQQISAGDSEFDAQLERSVRLLLGRSVRERTAG